MKKHYSEKEIHEFVLEKYVNNKKNIPDENDIIEHCNACMKCYELLKCFIDIECFYDKSLKIPQKVMDNFLNSIKSKTPQKSSAHHPVAVKLSNNRLEAVAKGFDISHKRVEAVYRGDNDNPDAIILKKEINGYFIELDISVKADRRSFHLQAILLKDNVQIKEDNYKIYLVKSSKPIEFIRLSESNHFNTTLTQDAYLLQVKHNDSTIIEIDLNLEVNE